MKYLQQHIHLEHSFELLQLALLLLNLAVGLSMSDLVEQRSSNVEDLLQLLRTFQLHVAVLVAVVLREDIEEPAQRGMTRYRQRYIVKPESIIANLC